MISTVGNVSRLTGVVDLATGSKEARISKSDESNLSRVRLKSEWVLLLSECFLCFLHSLDCKG